MGIVAANILRGRVMHARLTPVQNSFNYGIYYIGLPLSRLNECAITQNRFSYASFYNKDHGPCTGEPLLPWAKEVLGKYGITTADDEIVLICMPRILGYVFNPVSFWLCLDKQKNVRAVICEVHNTFGQHHSYLCAREDQEPISDQDRLIAKKLFHVSPFLKREGEYEFTFNINPQKFGVRIDYFDGEGTKMLVTSLTGNFKSLSKKSLRQVFWAYPLVTLKAISLIHWQALKLLSKGVKYVPKPKQNPDRLSATQNIKEI